MKFETLDDTRFKPFTILVESQEEVNLLAEVYGATFQTLADAFGLNYWELCGNYNYLAEKAANNRPSLTLTLDEE